MPTATFTDIAGLEFAGKRIQVASLVPLRIETTFGGETIGTATGFIDIGADGPVIVTSRHVVTGRHQDNGQPLDPGARLPDRITTLLRGDDLGSAVRHDQPLYDEQARANWWEHPKFGARVDLVAIPLVGPENVRLYPRPGYIDLPPQEPALVIAVMSPVAIIGYPFARHTAGFPVWTGGTIASEPDFDHDGLPLFLVDARTRPGQSGSPVVHHTHDSSYVSTHAFVSGAPTSTFFLGVYSGRIHRDSDIGHVWRPSALQALLTAATRSDAVDPN